MKYGVGLRRHVGCIFTLVAAAFSFHAEATAAQLTLQWTDNSPYETGFKIERKTGTAGTYTQVATVGVNVTSYLDPNLTTGTTYCYRVRAFNATQDSIFSNESCSTTAIPLITTAQLSLRWVDNSPNESGFKIERKTGTAGTYVQLATVGVNVTSYTDPGLATGTTYCYRVRAFNAMQDSPCSNESCSTTAGQASILAAAQVSTVPSSGSTPVTTSASLVGTAPANGLAPPAGNTKIGVFRPSTGQWFLDLNGNGKLDDCQTDGCPAPFGQPGDRPVVGDWTGTGTSQLGVFHPRTGLWELDRNGNGLWDGCILDFCLTPFGKSRDLPVAGRWQASAGADQIGVFHPSKGAWKLDLNNGTANACASDGCLGPFGLPGDLPVVGDWTGTGTAKIGTFAPHTGLWDLDLNGNGKFDGCLIDGCLGPFGQAGDIPVVGKW